MQNTNLEDADLWEENFFYPSSVYKLKKPSFLERVRESFETINKSVPDEIYPLSHTDNFLHETALGDFFSYLLSTSWNILSNQGYNVDNYGLYFTECWGQIHNKYSGHEIHTHAFQSVISGFYFVEIPDNSFKIVLNDPRSGKIQNNLYEKNVNVISAATTLIHLTPEVGDLYFMNSWFPHGFTRNRSDIPVKFVHFNIGTYDTRILKLIPPVSLNFDSDQTEVI